MKKTILLSSLFAVGAALASEVTSGNAVGALEKQISTSDAKQILISVPFLGYENGGAVKVCDMVKTSNLDAGSKLYVPDGTGTYNTWTLKLVNEKLEWVADEKVTIVSGSAPAVGTSDNQADATVARGSAFWLEPKFSTGTTDTIFLLGQAADGAGSSTAGNGWHLLGNASVNPVTIVNGDKVQEPDKDDTIVVQVNGRLRYYTYSTKKKAWRYTKDDGMLSNPDEEKLTIAPGQGFWYNSKVPVESVTFDWSTGVITKIYPKD